MSLVRSSRKMPTIVGRSLVGALILLRCAATNELLKSNIESHSGEDARCDDPETENRGGIESGEIRRNGGYFSILHICSGDGSEGADINDSRGGCALLWDEAFRAFG